MSSPSLIFLVALFGHCWPTLASGSGGRLPDNTTHGLIDVVIDDWDDEACQLGAGLLQVNHNRHDQEMERGPLDEKEGFMRAVERMSDAAAEQQRRIEIGGARTRPSRGQLGASRSELLGCSGVPAEIKLTLNESNGASLTYNLTNMSAGSCQEPSEGANGPTDCCLHWGSTFAIALDAELPEDISEAYTMKLNLKAEVTALVVDIQALYKSGECPVCGGHCELLDMEMPPCPLLKAGHIHKSFLVNLTNVHLDIPLDVPVKVHAWGALYKDEAYPLLKFDALLHL